MSAMLNYISMEKYKMSGQKVDLNFLTCISVFFNQLIKLVDINLNAGSIQTSG